MIPKYLIEEQTLTDIADSIRTMEKSSSPIAVEEYANHISNIEPSVEEYMRLSDYMDYPYNTLNENNYTEADVAKCQAYIDFYKEREV